MLLAILKFRAKQGFRMLQSIGLGVFIVFLPIAFLGILLLLQFLYNTPAPWTGILLLVGLLSVHYQRGDRFFFGTIDQSYLADLCHGVWTMVASLYYLFYYLGAMVEYWGELAREHPFGWGSTTLSTTKNRVCLGKLDACGLGTFFFVGMASWI